MVSTRNSPFQDFEKVNPEYNSGTQRIGDESLYLSLFSLDRSSEHQVPSRKVGEIDEPMKVFTSSKSSSAEKLRAAEDLFKKGVRELSFPDIYGSRKMHIEVQEVHGRSLIHVYAEDGQGKQQIALRGLDNHGKIEQQKDSRGREVGFVGDRYSASEKGKSSLLGDQAAEQEKEKLAEPVKQEAVKQEAAEQEKEKLAEAVKQEAAEQEKEKLAEPVRQEQVKQEAAEQEKEKLAEPVKQETPDQGKEKPVESAASDLERRKENSDSAEHAIPAEEKQFADRIHFGEVKDGDYMPQTISIDQSQKAPLVFLRVPHEDAYVDANGTKFDIKTDSLTGELSAVARVPNNEAHSYTWTRNGNQLEEKSDNYGARTVRVDNSLGELQMEAKFARGHKVPTSLKLRRDDGTTLEMKPGSWNWDKLYASGSDTPYLVSLDKGVLVMEKIGASGKPVESTTLSPGGDSITVANDAEGHPLIASKVKTNGKQYIRTLDGHWHEAATGKVLDVLIEGNTVRIKE